MILAFLCVYAAVRTKELAKEYHGYILIAVSLLVSAISYYPSIMETTTNAAIYKTINPFYYTVFAIPLLIIPLLILYDRRHFTAKKLVPLVFFLLVIGSMGFLLYSFYKIAPAFPTDESVFDMYAAHLFLSGKNPYDPGLMSSAFSFYHFSFQAFDPITPLTTGGYVNSLTYPALSFLIFIPAVIFKLKAAAIMLPALIAPMVIVWYRAWSRKQWLLSSYALLPFLSLLLYQYQGASADTDALWASLLMLSYFVLPKAKTSGTTFGLALSVKQFPIIVGPFLLYFIYREYGARKAVMWVAAALATFLLLNGYFIIQNPGYWVSSMVANEFAPLIGIGFGIPQVSFSGFLNVPNAFFTIAMVDVLLFLLALYMAKYREMKYSLFSFPILIFLLNYRLFPQYLYYWMIVSILPMLDMMHKAGKTDNGIEKVPMTSGPPASRSMKKTLSAVAVALILGGVALGFQAGILDNPGSFAISSVSFSGYNSTGYVDSMIVTITFHGQASQTPVYFRIFNNGPIINGNMFLWVAHNGTVLDKGQTYNLTITPQYPDYSVNPRHNFIVVAYYGNIQGSLPVQAR